MLTVCVLSSASLRRYTKIIVMIGYSCVAREKNVFMDFISMINLNFVKFMFDVNMENAYRIKENKDNTS